MYVERAIIAKLAAAMPTIRLNLSVLEFSLFVLGALVLPESVLLLVSDLVVADCEISLLSPMVFDVTATLLFFGSLFNVSAEAISAFGSVVEVTTFGVSAAVPTELELGATESSWLLLASTTGA